MNKLLLSIATITSITIGVSAQNVNIPDTNFKAYLVGNTGINTNADNEIQVTEAQAFSGYIICDGLGITDLTGIEEFTALTGLLCQQERFNKFGGNSKYCIEYFVLL